MQKRVLPCPGSGLPGKGVSHIFATNVNFRGEGVNKGTKENREKETKEE